MVPGRSSFPGLARSETARSAKARTGEPRAHLGWRWWSGREATHDHARDAETVVPFRVLSLPLAPTGEIREDARPHDSGRDDRSDWNEFRHESIVEAAPDGSSG